MAGAALACLSARSVLGSRMAEAEALRAENERLRAELRLRAENDKLRQENQQLHRWVAMAGALALALAVGVAAVLLGVPQQLEDPAPPIPTRHVDPAPPIPSVQTAPAPPKPAPAPDPQARPQPEPRPAAERPPPAAEPPPPAPARAPKDLDSAIGALPSLLASAQAQVEHDPWEALEVYRAALLTAGVGLPSSDEIGVAASAPKRLPRRRAVAAPLATALDEAAELYTATFQHDAALASHRLAHRLRRKQKPEPAPAELVLSAAGLATAYGKALRYDEALSALRAIEPLTASLPPQAVAVLGKQEASMHECSGDFVSALQRTEQSAKALGLPAAGEPSDLEGRLRHLELLRRVLHTFAVAAAVAGLFF